jgi:transcriptional regulator with XRE-family HTH domain
MSTFSPPHRFAGQMLASLRKKNGWSQEYLAFKLGGIDSTLISKWENYKESPTAYRFGQLKDIWPDINFDEFDPRAVKYSMEGVWLLCTNLWDKKSLQIAIVIGSSLPNKYGEYGAHLIYKENPYIWGGTWDLVESQLEINFYAPGRYRLFAVAKFDGGLSSRVGYLTQYSNNCITVAPFYLEPYVLFDVLNLKYEDTDISTFGNRAEILRKISLIKKIFRGDPFDYDDKLALAKELSFEIPEPLLDHVGRQFVEIDSQTTRSHLSLKWAASNRADGSDQAPVLLWKNLDIADLPADVRDPPTRPLHHRR